MVLGPVLSSNHIPQHMSRAFMSVHVGASYAGLNVNITHVVGSRGQPGGHTQTDFVDVSAGMKP